MRKNILICGENLNDGGVETAIVNDAIALQRKGNNVYILAKSGIYTKKVEPFGITNIDFEFEFVNGFDYEKAKKIAKIIRKNNIEEVHIHKFINIPSCLPACLVTNVPYIVHLQEGLNSSYEWVMKSFSMYKKMLEIYFKNAYKILPITENVKRYNMQLFDIPEEKYAVIHNSLDFNLFNNVKPNNKLPITNFLLISRLSKEKEGSIKNGIELFYRYSEKVPGCRMRIAGSGNIENEIKEYINQKGIFNIELLGRTENIPEEIEKSDIVLGLGRCIIEAMASKRLCCIIGYEKLKPILKEDILEQAKFENFSGRGLEDKTYEEIIDEIVNLGEDEIQNILEQNYNFAKEEFDINKNVYTIENETNIEYNSVISQLFEMLDKYRKDIYIEQKEKEEIWDGKVWIEQQYNNINKTLEYTKQQEEILQQKNTKKNKYYGFIKKILERLNNKK